MRRRPPRSTLFPYTPHFRSDHHLRAAEHAAADPGREGGEVEHRRGVQEHPAGREVVGGERSEEHTSELQSRQYLVCRLLLEKNKLDGDVTRYSGEALNEVCI